MSVVVKMIFLMLGITRTKEVKIPKKNATKFSKAVKSTMADDVRELSYRINNEKKTA